MVDISKLVQYEQTFPIAIKNPVNGDDIGITFHVVSMDCERVLAVDRAIDSERWQEVFGSESKKLTPAQISKFAAKSERERLIAAIAKWEWGGNKFGDLGADPEFSTENVRYVIEHPNARWIREQLTARAGDLANFSLPSEAPAKVTSA